MNKLVSVIVATYRRNEPLKKAIGSLVAQSYKPVEIIVVDDNADAEWNKTVFEIVSEFPNVHYICNQENKGSAETRNIGIRAAKGEYITFLDDDDIYLPEKIECQVRKMQEADADFSLTDLYLYSEEDKLIDKRIRSYVRSTDSKELLQCHLMYHMTGTDTMMFRKDYLMRIGGFPPIDVGDEFYLMSRALESGGSFLYVPGCHVKAYVHTGEDGLSSGQTKIDGENALYEYKKTMFDRVDKKTQKYIKMRHHAVLAFAYLRMKKYEVFVLEGIKAFISSPLDSVEIIKNRG